MAGLASQNKSSAIDIKIEIHGLSEAVYVYGFGDSNLIFTIENVAFG